MEVEEASEAMPSASRSQLLARLQMEIEFERGVGRMLQWLLLLMCLLGFLITGSHLEESYDARESLMRIMKFDGGDFADPATDLVHPGSGHHDQRIFQHLPAEVPANPDRCAIRV